MVLIICRFTCEDASHGGEALDDFYHNLMFHTLLIVIKFYTYNPTSDLSNYLWNGVTLHKKCHNLVTTLLQPYNVGAELLQPRDSIWEGTHSNVKGHTNSLSPHVACRKLSVINKGLHQAKQVIPTHAHK